MLYVDGHITGLYEEVADAGLRVFHHQLPGVIVIFRAAVAHACQQIVYLVAETALGQSHIQHPAAVGRGRRVLPHAGQLVQIQRVADGPRTGAELFRQRIVASALQNGAGQTCYIPLQNKAVVVFHVVDQRQIQLQPVRFPLRFQRSAQRAKLRQGCAHGGVESQRLRRFQHGVP